MKVHLLETRGAKAGEKGRTVCGLWLKYQPVAVIALPPPKSIAEHGSAAFDAVTCARCRKFWGLE